MHHAENPRLTDSYSARLCVSWDHSTALVAVPSHRAVSSRILVLMTFLQTVLFQMVKTNKRAYASRCRKHSMKLQIYPNPSGALMVH